VRGPGKTTCGRGATSRDAGGAESAGQFPAAEIAGAGGLLRERQSRRPTAKRKTRRPRLPKSAAKRKETGGAGAGAQKRRNSCHRARRRRGRANIPGATKKRIQTPPR